MEHLENELLEEMKNCGVNTSKLVDFNEEKNAFLFEDSSGCENDGCNANHLKEFFPNFIFDEHKNYFIQLEGKMYHGDALNKYMNDNIDKIYG